MRYRPYPTYKPSGVEWLGEIPAGWSTGPLKYATQFVNGMAFKPEDWSDEGVPIIRIENLNGAPEFNCFEGTVGDRYHVARGDLLFGWSGNRGTSFGPFLWWRDGLHYLNQHIFRLADFQCEESWLYWCLKAVTRTIEDEAHGIIGMVHVTKGKLGAVQIPSVSLPEQRAIGAFLDAQTARLDRLVARKLRLIERLKEKRTSLISRTVTRGLPPDAARAAGFDPHPKLKPSGIDWLGELPQQWEVLRLKHRLRSIEQGWSPECEARLADRQEWGVLKVGCVNADKFDASEHKALPASLEPIPKLEIRAGDVLMSRANTVELLGRTALVASIRPRLLLCDKLYRIKTVDVDTTYLAIVLNAPSSRFQYEREATGASPSMKNIGQDTVRNLLLPLPPIQEQRAIANYLGRETAKIDQMIDKIEAAIQGLEEYRTALVTAAVTGKIDVRGHVA